MLVDLTRLNQSGKKQLCLKHFNILKVTDMLTCCGMWMEEPKSYSKNFNLGEQ